jgi:hypothetical protein
MREEDLPSGEVRLALLKTADLLDVKGWIQGKWADGRGAHCMLGAIGSTVGTGSLLYWRLKREVRKQIGTFEIPNWNDEKGRTQEEVTSALRRAARDLLETT